MTPEENAPLISIITPAYNRGKFIGDAIESVIHQNYPFFEHIIVDDGSTDNTRELVRQYQKREPRIFYYYQENQGQSAARNNALARSKGVFVCFLDSDDYWLPGKIEESLAVFDKHPEFDVVYGDCFTVNEYGEIISRRNIKRYSGRIAATLLRDNFISMSTTMVRRRCFDEMGGMSSKRKVADDYDLWLRFASKYLFYYLPEYLACYRISKNQISSDTPRRFKVNEEIILAFLEEYPEAVPWKEAKINLSRFYARKARFFSRAGDKRTAWNAIFNAFKYAPSSMLVWRGVFRVIYPQRNFKLSG